MTDSKPYVSDFHDVPLYEWKCGQCTLTLHFKQDMGDRQKIVDDLISTHMEKHN